MYDTGGADIKTNGIMAGMHMDKCGAANIAGFVKTVSLLKPKGLEVRRADLESRKGSRRQIVECLALHGVACACVWCACVCGVWQC